MNVVILDGYTVNPGDLDWTPIANLGDLTIYDRTQDAEVVERAKSAEILIVNKVRITGAHMDAIQQLKAICLLATGYDNVDVGAATARNINVYNAVGYGTESVAQHTVAMILGFANRVKSHHDSVQMGDWSAQKDFSYSLHTVRELKGKTLGIIGYGKIGQRVGALARAFGMEVIALSRSGDKPGAKIVSKEELFRLSDFISLHAPLNDGTREIINQDSIDLMKSDAVIINTGRGALINEDDLISAISANKIGGAVLDVLSEEPPEASNPLFHFENVWVTPHMAWRSLEARKALIEIVAKNIENQLSGIDENRVN